MMEPETAMDTSLLGLDGGNMMGEGANDTSIIDGQNAADLSYIHANGEMAQEDFNNEQVEVNTSLLD